MKSETLNSQLPTLNSVDPAALRLHPAAKALPGEWPDDAPEFGVLCDDIKEHGIREPITITSNHQILDGRHRWRAARRLQLPAVPVRVLPDAEAAEIVLGSKLMRQHFTKGQRAYLAAPMFEAIVESGIARRAGNLKQGALKQLAASGAGITLAEFAAANGISCTLMDQARAIHAAFAEHPDWQATDEPQILHPDDPAGLGAILAGFAGRKSTKGQPKSPAKGPGIYLTNACLALGKWGQRWANLPKDHQELARAGLRRSLESCPPDFRKIILAELKRAAAND